MQDLPACHIKTTEGTEITENLFSGITPGFKTKAANMRSFTAIIKTNYRSFSKHSGRAKNSVPSVCSVVYKGSYST
ncbi:MAG: hypothetical protein JL50_07530 [Peptococcaceae bacterium BICA1-7]|nr:MAG: hypothetical protein JL50_07530 [Peptococcaceae bacterium BICA1-7]HBV97906.1 hypothetical protein [Desulfotomaculum sp.]